MLYLQSTRVCWCQQSPEVPTVQTRRRPLADHTDSTGYSGNNHTAWAIPLLPARWTTLSSTGSDPDPGSTAATATGHEAAAAPPQSDATTTNNRSIQPGFPQHMPVAVASLRTAAATSIHWHINPAVEKVENVYRVRGVGMPGLTRQSSMPYKHGHGLAIHIDQLM